MLSFFALLVCGRTAAVIRSETVMLYDVKDRGPAVVLLARYIDAPH